MDWQDFPLPDGSYSDDTRPWSQQDVVNYLPTLAELPGTRSRLKLEPAPGLLPYAVVGDGPHRGARDVEGRSFVVSGSKLYRVTATGIAIQIGTIPGTGFVSMTHNQIAGGNELVIGTRDNSYVYNTVTDTLAATGVGLSSVDFLGQYILGLSTDRRFWRHSALADATTYSDLDVYSAESAPDRLVGGIASQSEWLAFGERTIETYVNTPTETAAFQRMTGSVVEKGCANGNTIRRLDNSVFWLGNDLIVYRMQGYQPVPVSTKAMAAAFRACDPAKAFAFTYEDHGYVIYYLTFQDGQTWGYDVTNQRWHRRESFGLDRWRLNTLFKSNGEWYGGDYANGNLYKLQWGYMFEGESDVISRRIRSGVMHNNGNRVFVHGLKIAMDTGLPASVPVAFPVQPDPPTISGAAPDGALAVAYAGYAYTVVAGGAAIVSVKVVSGSLPGGLAMNSAGVIDTGTPTEIASYAFTIRVTDANGLWAELTDTINISAVSFATKLGQAGVLIVSATGEIWGGSIDTGLGDDVTLLKAAGGNVYAFAQVSGRVSVDSGASWQTVVFDGTPLTDFSGITYSNGVWILLEGNTAEVCWRSTNGINFEPVTMSIGNRAWYSIAAIGDTFVACSNSSRYYVSTDAGITWTFGTLGGITGSGQLVCGHKDIFAMLTTLANNNAGVLTSATGNSWVAHDPGFSSIGYNRITSKGDSIVIFNGLPVYRSDDEAQTWIPAGSLLGLSPSGIQGNNITHNGIRYIAGNNNTIQISDDAEDWAIAHTQGNTASSWNVTSLGEIPA